MVEHKAFGRAFLIVLGTALSALPHDLAAQQWMQSPAEEAFSFVQTSDRDKIREISRLLDDVFLVRTALMRAHETTARLENELAERAAILRAQISQILTTPAPEQWQQTDVARAENGHLPAGSSANQRFENTVH